MPNVNDLNQYLVATDVKTGDKLTFKDAGVILEKEFRGEKKMALEITVVLPSGKEKTMTVNKTSNKCLSEVYGPDTEKWVDLCAQVEILSQNVGGEIKDVIYLKPVA